MQAGDPGMSKARMLFRSRLKAESVDEYVRYHRAVWPDLLDAYRRAGITQISCFLSGTDLLVYSEYDVDVYRREKAALSRHPVEIKWQALMATLRDPTFKAVEYEEVFHMPDDRK
jgi:L-rhamnose mutarotase